MIGGENHEKLYDWTYHRICDLVGNSNTIYPASGASGRICNVKEKNMPAFGTTDIVFRYADGFKLERFVGEIGKNVFLTREEAEKKLEEMKNGK